MSPFFLIDNFFVIYLAIFYSNLLSNNVTSFPLDDEIIDLSHFGDKIFGKPSEEAGKKVESWSPEKGGNPEELGEYLEGDILFPNKPSTRNGLTAPSARWPKGRVPYVISPYFSNQDRQMIAQAMNDYHKMTCIRFVPRSSESDYINIVPSQSGCWSSVGRIGGAQDVNLQSPGCLTKKGTVIHELMHSIGFLHEQNRSDRDKYVDIIWRNIMIGRDNNFQKATSQTTSGYGAYDYRSVMHYSDTAFSTNGGRTIAPKITAELGQREGFSRHDVMKINKMYGCKV